MEQRIRDFMDITKQLVEASYDYLYRDNANGDWRNSLKEMELLKTRLNEAVKTLSSEELTELIEKDLKTCVDYKTADPLLWICGLDLKELPMSTPLVGSSIGVEYSPGVRICIGPDDQDYVCDLRFSVEVKDCSCHTVFDLWDMEEGLRGILETAEYVKEEVLGGGEKLTDGGLEGVSNFIDLKEKLVEASLKCHNESMYRWDSRIKVRDCLDALLNKAFKTLSKDEFADIVEKDLRTCVDCKTQEPLLWICGLDTNELPRGTAFGAEYSPGLWICIGTDAKGLYFSVEGEGFSYSSDFNGYNMEQRFFHILDRAEIHELTTKESLAELEEPDEER